MFHQVPSEEGPDMGDKPLMSRTAMAIRPDSDDSLDGQKSRKAPFYISVVSLLCVMMLAGHFLLPQIWNPTAMSSEGRIELDVLSPKKLIRWHCTNNEESNLPMQILDRAKGRGPWDFDYLDVKTGKYEQIAQLPKIEHEGIYGEKLNGCAMNPMDDWIYCHLKVVPEANRRDFRSYIVRVGIADADSRTAGLHFVAMVRKGSHYSGAFDLEGNYYFGPSKLHILSDLHLAPGKSFFHRHQVMQKTNIPTFKMPKVCQGADYAWSERVVDGKKQKFMWMLRDHTISAIDVSNFPAEKPICREWKASGLPQKAKGHFGAGWTFHRDGGAKVYFANNGGQGVFSIDNQDLNLDSDTIKLYKAGESQATNQNDGANCISIVAESPFHATPPPRKEPAAAPPQKHMQAPRKDAVRPPDFQPEKEEKEEKEAETPTETTTEAPKEAAPTKAPPPDLKPEKEGGPLEYDWVLMGPNTVCRMNEKDPIIWPKNKQLQTLTLAHTCIVEPCTVVPKQIPLSVEDCQRRCETFKGGCQGVEYRTSESRCEILARKTEWFIDNTKFRTVPGPLDFECWLYKPPCDLLIRLRDHGASSASFDWAWSVCFPADIESTKEVASEPVWP